jgi:hypothetical protein
MKKFGQFVKSVFNFFLFGAGCRSNPLINRQNPDRLRDRGFEWVSPAMSYFHWKYNQLSSALKCFTVLFGMGRRGSTTLWSPGNL